MMVMIISTQIIEAPPILSQRELHEAMRESHRAVGQNWQRTMLPHHFQAARQDKYNYRTRNPVYLLIKRRAARRGKVRKRGQALLSYSGLMEHLLTRPQRVRAFPTRATLMMHGPRYVGMRPMKGNRPNLGEEATRVTPDEQQTLTRVFDDTLTKQITQRQGRKVTRI